MAIQKLQLTVASKSKAKASDFNSATNKIDEIIDNIGNPAYYGVCNDVANEQYKSITIDAFASKNNKPLHGCMLVVCVTYGNTASNMHISINGTYSKPVYYGNAPVEDDVIVEDSTLTFVYNANVERWYITAGLSAPLPALYVKEYNLKNLIKGKYTAQNILSGIFSKLIGDVTNPTYEGNLILMLWAKTYIPVCLMEDEDPYSFEFIYGAKHYAFRIYKTPSDVYTLEINDSGSNIVTQWEE